MFIVIGYLIVMGSVFGGFALAGGHVASLFQPLELLMIGGGCELQPAASETDPRWAAEHGRCGAAPTRRATEP